MSQIIANDIERFRADIASYETELQNLRTAYKKALSDKLALSLMWDGPAHAAFITGFGSDLFSMEQSIRNFQQILSDMKTALEAYSRGERAVADIVSSLPQS